MVTIKLHFYENLSPEEVYPVFRNGQGVGWSRSYNNFFLAVTNLP